jgi:DNA-binding CsgD family transcriptional regulator
METDIDGLRAKYRTLLWRLVAVVCFFAFVTRCLLRFFVFGININRLTFFPMQVYLALYAVTIIAGAALIIRPLKLSIYIWVFAAWGAVHLVERSSIIGIVECVLAGMFAYHLEFFKTRTKTKVTVLLVVLFTALVWQVGYRLLANGAFLIWGIEFVLTVGMGTVLFFTELIRKKQAPAARLSDLSLAPEDIDILRRILQKEKYENIAACYNESLSTFNRHVREIFADIDIPDRQEFLRIYSDDDEAELPHI